MAALRIVVLEGDQTGQELLEQSLRVLEPEVIGFEVELERFDLWLESRRATGNGVCERAAAAMLEAGLGLKAATITPEGADDVGSPNRIIREGIDGKVIVRTGRRIPGVTPFGGVHLDVLDHPRPPRRAVASPRPSPAPRSFRSDLLPVASAFLDYRETRAAARLTALEIKIPFPGRVLLLGCGSVSQCFQPLALRHLERDFSKLTVMDFEDLRDAIPETLAAGADYVQERVTPENLPALLGRHLGPGDLLIDLAWNID
ncbi:MAG: saccharopine dehydrogenase NADP-binding domain-containing protein, partial [Solirubrobacterales bacterium]